MRFEVGGEVMSREEFLARWGAILRKRRRRRPTRFLGSGRHLADADVAGRLSTLARLDRDDVEVFEAVADLFHDTPSAAGCVPVGRRLRRDRLYVRAFVARHLLKMRPKDLAADLQIHPNYLRFCLRRGKALFTEALRDGRIILAVAEVDRRRAGRSHPASTDATPIRGGL